MSQSLFRKEAVDAQRVNWMGEISLAQPLRLTLLLAFAIAIAIAVGLLLVFGTYTKRWRVAGQLVPTNGLVSVSATNAGILSRVDAAEGMRVDAGSLLAVVTSPRATLREGDTAGAVEKYIAERRDGLRSARSAQAQALASQAEGIRRQLAIARSELAKIEQQVRTRADQVKLAEESLVHLRELQRVHYASDLQVRQQDDLVLERTDQLQTLQRDEIAARRLIAELEQSLGQADGQGLAAAAEFQGDLAALDQERVQSRAQGELAIVSPVPATVATQLVKPGQSVQAGQALFALIPGDGALEAQLLVPSRAIGSITTGAKVLLRYEAYPYQQFGYATGHVRAISRSALGTSEQALLTGTAAAGEQRYRITVVLDRQTVDVHGRAERLRPGMILEADVIGERRRLIEWILDPLVAMRDRFRAS
jgi:membrane fusion protein